MISPSSAHAALPAPAHDHASPFRRLLCARLGKPEVSDENLVLQSPAPALWVPYADRRALSRAP